MCTSVCLPALDPRVHPPLPIHADTLTSAHVVPARLPSTPSCATCPCLTGPHRPNAAGTPFQKQRLPLVPPAYSRESQQPSGQARGRGGGGLWTLGKGRPKFQPGWTWRDDGRNGGAGSGREAASSDRRPRGLRGSADPPEVRDVFPERVTARCPGPLRPLEQTPCRGCGWLRTPLPP